MKKYKVLFCDLDGTLIETLSGETFPKGIWDMQFKFNVLDAIRQLKPKCLYIVSNQGGIEKGFVNKETFPKKFDYIISVIHEYCNIEFVHGLYCSSNDKSSHNRKPNVGMLQYFYYDCDEYDFTKQDCLMIGDASGLEGQFSDSDKKTAENFGIDYLDVNEFVKQYNQ